MFAPSLGLSVMKNKLIILANAEKLCAYRVETDDVSSARRSIVRIETDLHHLLPDPIDVSDSDGRFPSGTLQHGAPMRHGESHGRISEKKKRQLDELISAICDLIDHEEFDLWNLAAPADIVDQLVERLPVHIKSKLTKVDKADYTGFSIKKIAGLFL